jgi:hypothetical protein
VEPVAILFGAVFTVAVATALGTRLLGPACREWPVRFVCGAAILSLVVFLLCCLGWVYAGVFVGVGVVVLAPLTYVRGSGEGPHQSRERKRAEGISKTVKVVFGLILATYFVIYLLNAMAPEVSPDGSAYHLSFVARYWREHGFHPITWNLYASLTEGLEMLFLFAFAFGRHSAAAMVHFAFLLALPWTMYLYARRSGFPLAGACAAVLVFVSPVVGIDGVSAYNDVALAAIAFTLFYVLQLWSEQRVARLLPAIGLLAGFAYAVKYTGWLAPVYAAGFVLWKSRRVRDAALVAASSIPMVAPWMLKNWFWVQNPVAPFFNQYFRNPFVTIQFEKEYTDYFRLYDLTSRWQIPKAVTFSSQLQGVLGPVFLLAPIALIALRWRAGRQLLLAAAVFGASYFGNIGARFLIPSLPFVAMAMAMVLASVPVLPVAVVLVHAVLSWPSMIPRYALPGSMHIMKAPWKDALRLRDSGYFMRIRLGDAYAAVRMIEDRTPPGATVFSFRPVPEAYTTRRVLIEYESAGNELLGRILRTAFAPGLLPTWRLRFDFPRQALAGIRVVQNASGRDLWSIHELRVVDGGSEVPRDSVWRLTANPFPWTIQNAFDNSPLTPWRTGEPIRPGMYVEVDFHKTEHADSVLIETSPDQSQIRLKLEGRDGNGRWTMLAAAPAISDAPPPLGLRRAAARELERRGVGYVLLFDGEFGADDFQANQDLWGIRQIGEAQGARLYQLP